MIPRILVIDDDPILAGLLQLTLQLEGFEVKIAGDGDAGMKILRAEKFDLILLDLVMPKIDGVKFLRLLNESNTDCPPVMVVSSAVDDRLTHQLRPLGVIDVARKPIEPAALVVRVKRALAEPARSSTAAYSVAGSV